MACARIASVVSVVLGDGDCDVSPPLCFCLLPSSIKALIMDGKKGAHGTKAPRHGRVKDKSEGSDSEDSRHCIAGLQLVGTSTS